MENLSSDGEDEEEPSTSVASMKSSIGCNLRELAGRLTLNLGHLRLRDRLTLNLGDLRDRLAHAIEDPASDWMVYAMIGSCLESLFFKRVTTSVYHISEMCYALRKEQEFEWTSQLLCMSMVICFSCSHLFYLNLIFLILANIFMNVVNKKLRSFGVTNYKIVKTYLTVLNLFWLLDAAWYYWTDAAYTVYL